ncbi:hypothetical protein CASFOL_026696 [Castilleja foliolosa]|uniref:Protein kinase domain-containing protein n=1 Tax=Castilleja foliolosa TaxID=1961234 RepID=A0ABD3CIT9_9LAMI
MILFYALHLFLLLHTQTAISQPYTATDLILLSCGAPSTTTDASNRTWDSDNRSRYAPNIPTTSLPSKASSMHPSVIRVPYETARVFQSPFTYTFPVLTGPKFLRLYFYPDTYSGFNTSQSFFSVTANAFTLLNNFSPFLNSEPSFMKEFIINVQENQRLNLTFTPNTNSFAFINGIEIVSIPDKLYFRGDNFQIKFIDQVYNLKHDTALETLYRLNVGGNNVEIQDDSGSTRGMFRAWDQDNDYILFENKGYTPHNYEAKIHYTADTPSYSAPEIVYKTSRVLSNGTNSLDWGFPVDSGFLYLLRFHFCEIQLEVIKQNQRVFTISVDNQTVVIDMDVIHFTGGTEIPVFKDYIVFVPDYEGHRGSKDMRLSLFPYTMGSAQFYNVLLNGLEIFKISDSNRSLAAANPEIISSLLPPAAVEQTVRRNSKLSSHVIYAAIGGAISVLAVIAALISWRRRKVKDSTTMSAAGGGESSWMPLSTTSRCTTRTGGSGKSLPSNLCRYFSIDEIRAATKNFDPNLVIGKGGFGNVYKGFIDNNTTTVAIKRLNPSSNQGVREFVTEIEMLSKLRHLHLVSLIGYSDEKGEMILVYDYMSYGTLRDHLYNSENSPLNWKQRLRICLGAAKGLHYLHTGAKHTIIHRDVKSTNILLDEKWVAKVSDFGLSKVGPTAGGANTHVTTVVKGSFGYVDPEYYRRQQLTEKSDVYSFGVVLFEVLCARPAIIPNLPKVQVNLAEWAKFCCRKGTIEQIVDSNLGGQIAPECLGKFVETAVSCLGDKGIERPAMNDVVWSLEFAMQLQEAAEHRGNGGEFAMSPSVHLLGDSEQNTANENMFSGSSEGNSGSKSSGLSTTASEKLNSGDVFSEIMNPIPR